MAKNQAATVSNLPMNTDKASALSLSAPFDDDEDAGRGVSQRPEDNLIPMVGVLQPMSPQVVDPRSKIPGAAAGDFLLKNAPVELIKGEAGMLLQPVELDIKWVEWNPREKGGGWVAQHATRPSEAKEVPDPQRANRSKWVMPSGSELIETAYRVCHVILEDEKNQGKMVPLAFPFASTGHTARRRWETLMNTFTTPSGQVAAAYAVIYRAKTVQKSNQAGTWFTPTFEAERKASPEERQKGRALWEALNKGEKQVDTSSLNEERTAPGVPPQQQNSNDEDEI